MSIADLVARHLADPHASVAIGTFGAIAEFHRNTDEPIELSARSAISARGGIRIDVERIERVIAWERPSSGDAWTHGIALCISRAGCAMNGRVVITELGRDSEALREEDRDAVLFDLGIGAAHCDIMVRTTDSAIVRVLRAGAGKALAATTLMQELPAMSPARVFASRLGRVEVFAPIPKPDGKTPDGPHTHLLPELLRLRRTHASTIPVPQGFVPCAEIFPSSSIHDAHGRRKPFDAAKHSTFQALLDKYGDRECVSAKIETCAAVRAGQAPTEVITYTRAQRLARRVALRQLLYTDGPSHTLSMWREKFDSDKQVKAEE